MNRLIISTHIQGHNGISLDNTNDGYFITIFDNNIEHSAIVLPDANFESPFVRPTAGHNDHDKRRREIQFFKNDDVVLLITNITNVIFSGVMGEKLLHHFSCTIHTANEIQNIIRGKTEGLEKALLDSIRSPILKRHLLKCEHHSEISDEREEVTYMITTSYNLKFNPKASNLMLQLIYPNLCLQYDDESCNLSNRSIGVTITPKSLTIIDGVDPYGLSKSQKFAFIYDKFNPQIKS